MTSSDSDSDSGWNKEFLAAVSKKPTKPKIISEEDRRRQMQECLDEGADVNTVDENGNTALHTAVKRGYQIIVEFLLRNGARLDISNRKSRTVITLAESLGKREIANIFRKTIPESISHLTGTGELTSVTNNQKPCTSRDSCAATHRLPTSDHEHNESDMSRKTKLDNAADGKRQRTSSGEGPHSGERDEEVGEIPAFEEGRTYSAADTLTRSWPGIVYQLKHLAFTLHCALQQKDPQFFLATEMIEAEKLDDAVLLYKNGSGRRVGRFVQIKYAIKQTERISAAQLLEADGNFSVLTYFISWRKLKEKKRFGNVEKRNMILCTNRGLDLDNLRQNNIHYESAEEPDKSFELRSELKIGTEKTAWFKLSANEESNGKLYDKLKETSDIRKLGKLLAECIYKRKDMRLETDIFRRYHVALKENVFDPDKKEIHKKFIDNEELSPTVEKLREIFISECKEMAKLAGTDASEFIWKDVQKRFGKLTFRKDFGKAPKVPDPQLTNLDELSRDFAELLKNARNYVVRFEIQKSMADGAKEPVSVVEGNLKKLTGHVLIKVGKKVKFSSQFLEDGGQSSGNLDRFKTSLKEQVGGELDLRQFEFDIKNYECCTEKELLAKDNFSDDMVSDEEISKFLEEFILAVNQPDGDELAGLIKKKMDALSPFSLPDNEIFDCAFQTKMFDWFAKKGKQGNEKEYLSYEVGKKFVDDMNQTVGSFITIGVSSVYCEQIKAYDVHYKSDVQRVKAFLTENRCHSIGDRILKLATPEETLLTALRVYDTLARTPKYKKMGSFIFTRVDSLKSSWIFETMVNSFGSESYPDLLVVDCESNNAYQHLQELCEPLREIIAKNIHKRMIIIIEEVVDSGTKFKLPHQTYCVKDDDHSFGNLTNDSQSKLLRKRVTNFQGHIIGTSFGELLGIVNVDNLEADESNDLSEIIDSRTLLGLIRGNGLQVGCDLTRSEKITDYYVNRNIFQRVVIKPDILEDKDVPDLVAVSGMDREYPGELLQLGKSPLVTWNPKIGLFAVKSIDTDFHQRLVQDVETLPMAKISTNYAILENTKEEEEFKALCTKNKNRNIHWLEKESGKYVWKKSYGVINYLIKYRDPRESGDCNARTGATELNESQLAAHDEPVIISETAGMGKSVLLTHIACEIKHKSPEMLVLVINLKYHSTALAEVGEKPGHNLGNIRGAVQFLIEKILSTETNLAKKIFKRMIDKRRQVALIFDGFDEISPTYEGTVIDLLRTFANYGIKKLYVATRPHAKGALESKLNAFSYGIRPLSTDDQKEFLTQYWISKLGSDHNSERIRTYAEAIMKKLASSTGDRTNEFTGIPLQTWLLAEIFQRYGKGRRENFDSCGEFLNSKVDQPTFPEKINLAWLYEHFVQKNFDHYFDKRGGDLKDVTVIEDRRLRYDVFMSSHEELALNTLFDEEKVKKLLPFRPGKSYRYVVEERTGIITEFIDGKPHFVHRTYAEYFAAKFLVNMLKERDQDESSTEIFVADIFLAESYGVIRAFLNWLLSDDHIKLEAETWKFHLNKHRSAFKESVFHVAAAEDNHHIIKLFLNCLRTNPGDLGVLINEEDILGRTAVHRAIGHLDGIKLLVKHAISKINAQDITGSTPLHLAAVNGKLNIVKYLLGKGANVNCQDSVGCTPLHVAAYKGELEIVRYLLDKGATVNCQDNAGSTPLHVAAQEGKLDVVKYLLDKRADISSQSNDGAMPLHIAAYEGKLDVVRYLLGKGANVNCRDIVGGTPLHVAAQEGKLDVVKYLLDKRADINSQTNIGVTPLHLAAFKGELEVVIYLLYRRADVNSPNTNGSTPLYFAFHEGKWSVVRYLFGKGGTINSSMNVG